MNTTPYLEMSGFGFTNNQIGFGQQNQTSTFGQSASIGFGAVPPASQIAFGGQTQQSAIGFGGQPAQSTFGTQPQRIGFGGQPTQPSFGGQPTQSTFGTQPTQPAFGQPQQPVAAGSPSYQYPQTPIFAQVMGNDLVTVHINGLITLTSQTGQKREVNLGVSVLDADARENELVIATAKGVANMNCVTGQIRQIFAAYALPVGRVKFINKDYLAASFVDMNNGQVCTVQAKSAGSRWGSQQPQTPAAILYTVVVLDLNRPDQEPLATTEGLPSNGLFEIHESTTGYSYNKDLCTLFVPCLPSYVDDDVIIKSYTVKQQSNTLKMDNSTYDKVTKSQMGVDTIQAGFSGYWYCKAKKVHCLATEAGEIYASSTSSSSSRSSYSYGKTSSTSQKFNFNMRINCCQYDERDGVLLIGLQSGDIALWPQQKDPIPLGKLQQEITCFALKDSTLFVGTGSYQNPQSPGAIQIAELKNDGRGNFVLQ